MQVTAPPPFQCIFGFRVWFNVAVLQSDCFDYWKCVQLNNSCM